jgi:hypothetical protein
VRGRGAIHQVDVLGEFALTPAFSLPIRLFLEAKYYRTPCELNVVRNAHGVIHDVNENFIHMSGSRPRRRYQYAYALFSASGFSRAAQDYALAQQISLVDLSGVSFDWLRHDVSDAAVRLYDLRNQHRIRRFPVSWMRRQLRNRLGTPTLDETLQDGLLDPSAGTNAPLFRAAAEGVLTDFASALRGRERTELLLGFPAAPFILPLAADDPTGFLHYANQWTAHAVGLRRIGTGLGAEWELSPRQNPDAYRLTFNLPHRVEQWISENDDWQAKRTRAIKNDLLPHITVYRGDRQNMRVYQLRYEPSELRRPRP